MSSAEIAQKKPLAPVGGSDPIDLPRKNPGLVKTVVRAPKRLVLAAMPASFRESLKRMRAASRVFPSFFYDFRRFVKCSSAIAEDSQAAKLSAMITMTYHRLEKGLALREPRIGFGKPVARELLEAVTQQGKLYGFDDAGLVALNVLSVYQKFNVTHGVEDAQFGRELEKLKSKAPQAGTLEGGTLRVTKKQIHEAAKIDLAGFLNTRFSVRHFAPGEVPVNLIERAVQMAQKTPSVCNRQAWKVHIFAEPADRQRVLQYQNGNRGFGDQLDKVLIVTCDLGRFLTTGERNQCWVDGGMFAMSVVFALHSLGVGTCCLNCSIEHGVDRALHVAAKIPENEVIIMMVGVGQLPEEFSVAQSPRRKLSEVIIKH